MDKNEILAAQKVAQIMNGKENKEISSWKFITLATVLVLFLVVLSVFIRIYFIRDQCFNAASPWCYKDWCCEDLAESDPEDPKVYPACFTQKVAQDCVPLEDGSLPPECTDLWRLNCDGCEGCDYNGPFKS